MQRLHWPFLASNRLLWRTVLRFIVKTALDGRVPLRAGLLPVLENYRKLQDALTGRAGSEAARLFAEPIVTWGNGAAAGSVSWYAEADGEVQPLSSLPPERRGRLEQSLQTALARLLPLRSDPEIGPLLSRALVLADANGILAVGDRVVLVDWGLIGPDATDTPAGLDAQFEAILGRFAPPETGAGSPSVTAQAAAPAPPPATTAATAIQAAPPAASVGPVWNRWLLPAALAIAAAFLALGLLLGARGIERQFAARPNTVHVGNADAVRDAVARRQAENAALQAEIEAARRALAGNVCLADAAKVPSTVPPETPITPAMRPPAPPGGAPFQVTLVELLRQATVLVLVPKENGLSLGTGFFTAPNQVVTNRHVVEAAGPDGIVVVNEKLGRPMRASILAETPDSEIYHPDVAVLQVPDAPAIQPLSFTRTIGQLDTVVAAGFPGVLMSADDSFSRLLQGDLAAMPSVILTDGRINAVQTASTGMPILPHSAQIAPGNSGGPLVDACGRVVGINTFVNVSAAEAVHINYAEKSDAVLDFLQDKQVPATESAGPCAPGGTAAGPPAADAAARSLGAGPAAAPPPADAPAAPAR